MSCRGRYFEDRAADEATKGFLLNHLISEELPRSEDGAHLSNSDPITGQAGWYDVHVRIYPAEPGEPKLSSPQFDPLRTVPGQAQDKKRGRWLTFFAGRKKA